MRFELLRPTALYGLMCCMIGCAAQGPLRPGYVAAPKLITRDGLVQIENGTGFLSYHAPAPKDVPGYRYVGRARGEVCQNDLQLPMLLQGSHQPAALSHPQSLELIWGNAAVAAGVADALVKAPAGAVLYDLTLDMHHVSLFGLFFRRQCLVVSGSMAVPVTGGAAAAAPTAAPPPAVEAPKPSPSTSPAPPAEPAPAAPAWPVPAAPAPGQEPALRGIAPAPAHQAKHQGRSNVRRGHKKVHRGGNGKHTASSSRRGERRAKPR